MKNITLLAGLIFLLIAKHIQVYAQTSAPGKLTWATYFGKGTEQATAVATDSAGNIYIGGNTSSTGIATSGAYQTSLNSGKGDAFLAKFNKSGGLLWATYYGGGSGVVSISAICINNAGQLYISGSTTSASGIATQGAYQTSFGGGSDAFLGKFSSSGTLLWATYYGNTDAEYSYALCTDKFGNAIITGLTSFGSGYYNYAFLAKFDSTGKYVWAENFGNGNDYGNAVAIDKSGNIYLGGYTKSTSGIATTGAYQTSLAGKDPFGGTAFNAFLAKFDASGKLKWGTYYGGAGSDYATGLATDANGNIYMAGQAESLTNIATSGAYQTSNGGGNSDGFLSKFDSTGNLKWATYYGGSATDKVSGVCVNPSGNVFITGYTFSSNNIATSGAYLSSNSSTSNGDAFLAKFNSDGSLAFGSYYGGSGGANGYAVCNDLYDDIYMAGQTSSSNGISTSGAYQSSLSGGENAFLAKFGFSISNDAGIASIQAPGVKFCPGKDSVKVLVRNYGTVSLTKATIGLSINGTVESPYLWSGSIASGASLLVSVGSYNFSQGANIIKAWTSSPNGVTDSLNSNDTTTVTDSAIAPKVFISGTLATQCRRNNITLGKAAAAGDTYLWSSNPVGFTSTISNPTITLYNNSTYILKETNALGCSSKDSVAIKVAPNPPFITNTTKSLCRGTGLVISTLSTLGGSYSWTSVPAGFTSTSKNPSIQPSVTTTYKVKGTGVNTSGCVNAFDSILITVNPVPHSVFSYTPTCPDDSLVFNNKSDSAVNYLWYFGDGKTSKLTSPNYLFTSNGTYIVSLKATNASGCSDSTSKKITISPCVWPGDANDDKVVDMKDLLAIGIAYGTVGHARPSASINWTGQPSPDWDSSFSGGVNYKHADCNGDSVINYKDTLAVSANYGSTHSKSGVANQGSPSDPELSIKYLKDTFFAGDTLVAQIMIGSASKPVANLYGFAFSLALDPALFEINNAFLKMNTSFFAAKISDVITMNKKDVSSGTMDIGISKINHLNASGNGLIATLYVPVNKTLTQNYVKSSLSISNNYQVSNSGKSVPLYLTSDTILIKQDHTGINVPIGERKLGINVFPNPFQSNVTISYNLDQKSRIKIDVFDLEGKQIASITNEEEVPGLHQLNINAEKYHLNPGVYLLKFIVNDQVESRRLVKF